MRTFVSILLIIVSVGAFIVFIGPKWGEIQGIKELQAEYDVALENAQRLQAERDKLVAQKDSFSPEDLDNLNTLLPDNIDNVKLIIELDALAAKYGMALQDVSVIEESARSNEEAILLDASPYGTVNLEFSLAGPYDRFVSFVEDVESSLRLIDVYEIDFQTPILNENYQYRVKIRTYWLK